MPKVYRTHDYGHIPIQDIEDRNLCDFVQIANLTIRELCEKQNANLLICPPQLDAYKDNLADNCIFTIDEQNLQTGDLLGFIGKNESQLTIGTRFAKDSSEDYFLHYMLQKVFRINLLDLKHSTSGEKIFDFLVYMFPFYLKRALQQGLYKEYIHRDYNDANVRGTINIPQHIRHNIPFSGNVAYRVKEYAYDNNLTQLIRHTIEYIRSSNMASVLKIDADTEAYVSQICSATPSYRRGALGSVIVKNLKSIRHPYYTEYRALQKLCVSILQHKRLKYGIGDNRIYGLLFSGSWLWEEFLYKTVLNECGFLHPQNRSGKGGIYLFHKSNADIDFVMSRCKRYPDYFKENCILDAKYKHLDDNRIDRNDMHQIISYMHVEEAGIGGFIYPTSQDNVTVTKLGDLRGYGGSIYNIGVPIPKESGTFAMFVAAMKNVQQELKEKILALC